MPVEEVAGGVEDGLDVAFLEVAALDDGVEGFECVGLVELEGSGEEEAWGRSGVGGVLEGEVEECAVGGECECVGVGVEGRGEVGVDHAP